MDGYDVSFVLTSTWKVHVLTHEACCLYTHVEFGVVNATSLNGSFDLISTRSWNLSSIDHIRSEGVTNSIFMQMVSLNHLHILNVI